MQTWNEMNSSCSNYLAINEQEENTRKENKIYSEL